LTEDAMPIVIEILPGPNAGAQRVEIVERKGLGHPDTICDLLSERLSVALSKYYLGQFGLILHHNVDKALLAAGRSSPIPRFQLSRLPLARTAPLCRSPGTCQAVPSR
jgi:S-adenosylmethionine synthetase